MVFIRVITVYLKKKDQTLNFTDKRLVLTFFPTKMNPKKKKEKLTNGFQKGNYYLLQKKRPKINFCRKWQIIFDQLLQKSIFKKKENGFKHKNNKK